jgi:hypothetical protein
MKAADPKRRWNKCNRLPQIEDDVLLLVDGMYYIGCWEKELEGGMWWVYGMHSMFDMKPTHWRYLPKRPRSVK